MEAVSGAGGRVTGAAATAAAPLLAAVVAAACAAASLAIWRLKAAGSRHCLGGGASL
jgi:hypothetical protein